MTGANRYDPYRNLKFRLEIDGIVRAGFRECAGLDHETVEGDAARKLPDQSKYSNISLKMGKTDDKDLLSWHKESAEGKTQRKNGSIILMNERDEKTARWNFVKGWPTKWTGPSFNADANDVAIDTLEIAHEGLTMA